MKRTPARATIAFLALVTVAVGLTACSGGTPLSQAPASTASTQAPTASAGTGSGDGSQTSGTTSRGSATGSAPSGAGAVRAGCRLGWTTGVDDGGLAMNPSALYLVRAGRHACYDRVVFDVNGSGAVGFSGRYVPVVRADGSGEPVPVDGGAALEIVVRAPVTDAEGHQPWRRLPQLGDDLVAPGTIAGWPSLTQVAYAGSFEGQTTIAVGVREKQPFRIWTMTQDGSRHVVLDIAH